MARQVRVELLRGAEADLLEVYVRLEDGRPGLGECFYRTIDLALERLRQHPEMARPSIAAHIVASS